MLKVEYSHFQDAKKKRRGNSGERDLSENIPSESVSVRWNKNALRKLWNVSCRDFIPVADLWRIYQGHIQNNIRKKFSYENSSFVLDFMVEPWSADRCEPTSRFFDDSQTGSNEPSKFGYQSDELKVTGLDDEDIIQTCSSSTYYIHLEENLQLSNEYPIYQLFHDVLFVPSQLTTYWDSQWMKIFLDRVHLHLDIDSLMQIVFRHLNIKGEMVKTKIEFKREESITNIRAKILSVLKQNMLDTAADEENVEFQEKFLADFYGEQTANNNNEVCTESITETLDNYCATESTNEIVLAELFEDSTLDEVDYSMKATPNLYLKPFNDSSLHVSFLPDPLPLACLELNSQLAFYLLRWLIRIMKQDFTTTTTSKLKDPLTYIETWERNEQFKYLDEIIETLMTDNYLPISRRNRWSKKRLFSLHPSLVRFVYVDLLEWKIYRSLFIPHVMLPTDCGHNGLGSSHGKTPEQARAILENIPGWSLIKAFGTQLVSFEQRYLRSRLKRKSNPTNGSPFPNSMLKIYEWILNRFIVYDRPYELYLLLRAYFPDLNELSRTTYLRVLTFSSNSRTSLFSTNKSLNRLQHLKELIYELFVGEKEGLLFLKNMKSSKFKEKCARLVLLDGNLDKSLFLQFLFEENEGSSNKIVSNDINEKLLWNFLDFWLVNFSAQFQFGGSFYAATATRTKNLSQLIPFFLLEQIQNFDKTIKRKELKELLHFMEAFYVPILGKILPQVETDFSLLCNCIALLESKENQGLKPKWNRRKRKNLLHQDLKLEIFLLRLNDLLFRTCFLMLKKEIKRTGFKSTTPWDTTTLWHLYLGVLEFTNLLKPNLQLVPFQPADIIEGRNLNFNTGFNDGLNMETYRLFSVEFLYAFITLAADCNDYYNAVQMIRYLRQFPIAFSDGHDLYELCMERHIDPMSSNHTSRRKNSSTSYVTMGDYFDSKSIGVSIISPLQMNTGSKLTIPLEFIGPFNTLEKIIRDRYYLPLFLKITQIPDLLKTLGRNSYGYLVPYYQRSTSTTDGKESADLAQLDVISLTNSRTNFELNSDKFYQFCGVLYESVSHWQRDISMKRLIRETRLPKLDVLLKMPQENIRYEVAHSIHIEDEYQEDVKKTKEPFLGIGTGGLRISRLQASLESSQRNSSQSSLATTSSRGEDCLDMMNEFVNFSTNISTDSTVIYEELPNEIAVNYPIKREDILDLKKRETLNHVPRLSLPLNPVPDLSLPVNVVGSPSLPVSPVMNLPLSLHESPFRNIIHEYNLNLLVRQSNSNFQLNTVSDLLLLETDLLYFLLYLYSSSFRENSADLNVNEERMLFSSRTEWIEDLEFLLEKPNLMNPNKIPWLGYSEKVQLGPCGSLREVPFLRFNPIAFRGLSIACKSVPMKGIQGNTYLQSTIIMTKKVSILRNTVPFQFCFI